MEAVFVAIGGVVGGLITAIVGATVLILNTVHKNKQEAGKRQAEDDVRSVIDYKALFDRQEADLQQLRSVVDRLQRDMQEVFAEHALCAADAEAMQVWARYATDLLKRLGDYCRSKGYDVGDVSPPPHRHSSLSRSEFLLRRSQHDAGLTKPTAPTTAITTAPTSPGVGNANPPGG